MVAAWPIACSEKQRLLHAFTDAISEYHRLQLAQLEVLLHDERFDFVIEIARAAERRELAKYAVMAHQDEHGC
jgi:hypothetical protein